jgi:hypothetical protein
VEKRLLREGSDGRIRIAGCWDPSRSLFLADIYKDIHWVFAGSIFGGSANAICMFGEKMREMCFRVLRERNTLMWEINVWVLIYREVPELFSWYQSDHTCVIFNGYT